MYTAKSAKAMRKPSFLSESWNACAVPWNVPRMPAGILNLRFGLRDRVNRFAQRDARREVERDRHRGKLTLVVDGERGLCRARSG